MENEIHAYNLARNPEALYHLQGDGVDWQTGFTKDGDKLLIIRMFPDLLAIRFSPDGYFDRVVSVPGFPSRSSGYFSEQDEDSLSEWLNQVGFQPGLIRVKKFFLLNKKVGISDLPSYYKNILLNPIEYSQDEQTFAQRELSRWSKEGIFELSLSEHNDLWIDKAGNIIAT